MSTILRTPSFIRATTPEKLRELMLRNNIENHMEHHYFDIQRDGVFWIVWYMTTKPNVAPEEEKVADPVKVKVTRVKKPSTKKK